MRLLGLDIGEKRVGIAFGDTSDGRVFPLKVLSAQEVLDHAKSFRYLIEDYDPQRLVVGLPISLDGEEGPQALRVREAALRIQEHTQLTCDFVDERLSSAQAKRLMHEAGLNEKQMRGKLDSVAASIFLQTYIDAHHDSCDDLLTCGQ